MDKPWLAQYPAGIPAEIDVDQFASLKDVLRSSGTFTLTGIESDRPMSCTSNPPGIDSPPPTP